MSHIANAIEELLKEKQVTAADVAHVSGMPEAQISRIRNGRQVWISSKDLLGLATALAPQAGEELCKIHARLLFAHLRNECSGPGRACLSINLNSELAAQQNCREITKPNVMLPLKLREDLTVIEQHISGNRLVRNLIAPIADYCRSLNISPVETATPSRGIGECPDNMPLQTSVRDAGSR